MIITCKKDIPLRWVIFAILPSASFGYTWNVIGVAFLFSLKKFVENPAGLTFILSMPTVVSLLVGPSVSFLSDRIWTRFGRRKPFIVPSWAGITLCMALMPLMPNFWSLLAVYMCFNFSNDFNVLDPLSQEIIPPHERGRATGASQWCSNLACLFFFFIALGRFDDVRFMAGMPVIGESVIYWSAALLLSVMLMLIMLGIKEVDQKSALLGEKFSFKNFFGAISDRELWPIYLLPVGWGALCSGLGPLGNLLYTDQWGYTKQDMGINVAVGGTLNIFIIGLLTVFADKLSRLRAYRTLLCIAAALNFLYFCYVTFVLPDQRPSLVEIIAFGETGSIIGMLTGMVYVPMVYDYIRRNKMGTFGAGAGMVYRLIGLIALNGVGLFIWGYSTLFQPPAGEMARVVLRGESREQAQVRSALRSTSWTNPGDGSPVAPTNIEVNAWQANGTVSNTGRCWEVRLRDKSSETLAAEKERLLKTESPLVTEEKLLREKVSVLNSKGSGAAATRAEQNANKKKVQIDGLVARIGEIDATLSKRAANFQQQVAKALDDQLITEGDQVLGVRFRQALLVELATANRPDVHILEKTLEQLRRDCPGVIDLRPMKLDTGFGVAVSAILEPGADEDAFARDLQASVERAALKHSHGLLEPGSAPMSRSRQPALTIDVMVVEEPLDTYVSPIHHGVNLVLRLFDQVPSPGRRLAAMARNLRVPSEINHIRVNPGAAPKTISITAVLPSNAPKSASLADPIGQRLLGLIGEGGAKEALPQARAFYDRVETAASTQRLTVARPLLAASYTAIKYNYMCGYLWMTMLGLFSIFLTLVFSRFESKGVIKKRGIEEAEAS